MTTMSDLHESYTLARLAQEQRAEDYGRAAGYGANDETDAYLGRGEYMGSGVERSIVWRDWLVSAARDRAYEREQREAWESKQAELARLAEIEACQTGLTPAEAFRLRRPQLIPLAEIGDRVAIAELERRTAKRAGRRQMVAA